MKFFKCLRFVCLQLLLAQAALLALLGCDAAKSEELSSENRVLSLMTWNIHNLFDGKDDGFEYAEFQQASGWSKEKYKGRLNNISAAIGSIDPMPDVIVFQEIESLQVLEELAAMLSKAYSWSHFANNPESGIGVGIISRFEIPEGKSHSININGEITPRPVLEARVRTGTGDFIVFACHWKSKLGGDEATENVRRASARVILRRIRDINANEPDTGIIVAGDLNENFDEFYRRGSSPVCALLPDDQKSLKIAAKLFTVEGNLEQKDFIVISGNMPPTPLHFPPDIITLYSPWINELEFGSYYYRGNWETIDHFLLSNHFFDNSALEYESAYIVDSEPFAKPDGTPVPYSMKTGAGLSDHLPLMIYLKCR